MKKLINKVNLDILHLFLPISVIFLSFMFILKPQSSMYLKIVVIVTFLYLSLTMIHHYFDKSLNKETFLEYLLIAFLVLIMIAGVII